MNERSSSKECCAPFVYILKSIDKFVNLFAKSIISNFILSLQIKSLKNYLTP